MKKRLQRSSAPGRQGKDFDVGSPLGIRGQTFSCYMIKHSFIAVRSRNMLPFLDRPSPSLEHLCIECWSKTLCWARICVRCYLMQTKEGPNSTLTPVYDNPWIRYKLGMAMAPQKIWEKAPGGQAPKAGNPEVGEGWDLGRKLRSQGLHRAKQLGVSKIHSTRVSVSFFNMIIYSYYSC